MSELGTAEVSRIADIPVRSIRAMVRARYVSPTRGPRGALRFSFQDVILIRSAHTLIAANNSPRRVGDALRRMRARLPSTLPTHGLNIAEVGGRIVVHQAGATQDAGSGQLLLAFDFRMDGAAIEVVDLSPSRPPELPAQEDPIALQFEAAVALEDSDPDAAAEAYRICIAQHAHSGATANLGRLLHLQGRISEALELYRAVASPNADILYNLGVAAEDLGNSEEAIAAYQAALALDPDCADAHHNLARLWQEAGDHRRALRHFSAYRRLSASNRRL